MDIYRAEEALTCTSRISGLQQQGLRILRDNKGKRHVAVDPVGARSGNWVFTASGSAARHATGNYQVLTDLTICGIIDFWEAETN